MLWCFTILTEEQREIVKEIIASVLSDWDRLFFLRDSAGTGETFIVKAIGNELRRQGRKCLITAITGIAAVQYSRGTTLHSLVRLGNREASCGEFRSSIGRATPQARYILWAERNVIDKVSMSTSWIVNWVPLMLSSLCENEIAFSGKKILFVGDLFQPPPMEDSLCFMDWLWGVHVGIRFRSFVFDQMFGRGMLIGVPVRCRCHCGTRTTVLDGATWLAALRWRLPMFRLLPNVSVVQEWNLGSLFPSRVRSDWRVWQCKGPPCHDSKRGNHKWVICW
jgi:hypothetical protein